MRLWNNLPIVYKLFITLVAGIAVIIISLLSYLSGYESDLMLNKEQDLLHTQSKLEAKELNTHVERLQKEILFLSHLEIMDDMVAYDLDRRISSLLKQKADDLEESISLFMVAPDFTIPASSKTAQINTNFKAAHALKSAVKHEKSYFFLGDNLYLFTPVYGSFNTKEFLGYLVMSYPLENFALQLKSDQSVYRWITPPYYLSKHYKNNSPILDENSYLHDTITLSGALNEWTLHYAIPKKDTLAMLYHYQTLFLSAFAIGLILITFLVWIVVLRIVAPLRELSNTAKSIAITGDYSQTVTETGNDEIGMMAHSFNILMSTTRLSMERIELLGKTQAALRAKSSFLSSMSHELRTPLGSILSLTQYLMTQPQTSEPVVETLGKIENSAHHLLGVINNILDLAKVESGKMEPKIALCDPIHVVQSALELVSPLAEDKGLQIITRFMPFEGIVKSDAHLLRQVIINLLSNAIKFTEHGSIEVSLQHFKGIFMLEVKDSGCGIAHESLEHLFDDFYQVRKQHHSSFEGSGLGLAISKRIALLLHGDLIITSSGEGFGTTASFHFRTF